jgi:glycosyltransferase involved in cell wall biosynthesis
LRKVDICVLIPHYNALRALEKSLASISNFEPVDVVIVDDGSNIKPDEEELKRKFPQINNIKVILNEKNKGIEHALNDGLKYIIDHNYKYIARLDCGDLCHPKRFKLQKEFLEKNPSVYLVGTWVEFVDLQGNILFKYTPPTNHEEIKRKMCINNMFIHPSVMFRSEAVKEIGFYPTNRKNAEDYAYFFQFVNRFKTANINKFLLKYEVNPQGLSLSKRKLQIKNRIRIILDNFKPNFWCLYGLLRNLLVYFFPYSTIEFLKRRFWNANSPHS